MKTELQDMQQVMKDILRSLTKLVATTEVAYQKQTADVAMQARITLAGITGLLKHVDNIKEV